MALLLPIYGMCVTVKHVAYAAPAVPTYAAPAYASTYGSHIVSWSLTINCSTRLDARCVRARVVIRIPFGLRF